MNEKGTDTVWGVPISEIAQVTPEAFRRAYEATSGAFTTNQMTMAQQGYELEQSLVTQEFTINLQREVLAEAKRHKEALLMKKMTANPGAGQQKYAPRLEPKLIGPNMDWLNGEIRRIREKAFS